MKAFTAVPTDAVSPPMTHCATLLMFAATTYPSIFSSVASTTAGGAMTAAMQPLSARWMLDISRPRAAAASSPWANGMAPAATIAAYSPSEWPMTTSGTNPYSRRSRSRAMSVVRTAGCVMAVCIRAVSASFSFAGSSVSTKK